MATKQSIGIKGINNDLGKEKNLTLGLIRSNALINIAKFATIKVPNINSSSPGWLKAMVGPTITPCKFNAAKKAAAGALPGIPNTRVGIKAPPILALLATSEHTTPSTSPFEKSLLVICSPTP